MLRVIIAEDEELIREGLHREIPWASLGMEVVGLAAQGREALDRCRELSPDILLTDIRMPFMDGLELIREVRAIDERVVVLIISGYDDFHYAQQAISLGVSRYFLKPLELDKIEAELRETGRRIQQERERSARQAELGRFIHDVLPFVRRQYFLELIYGPYDDPEIAGRLSGIGGLNDRSCCAAVLARVALGPERESHNAVEGRCGRLLRNAHYSGEDIYLLKRTGREALFVAVLIGEDPERLGERRDRYVQAVSELEPVMSAAGGAVHRNIRSLHESFVEPRKELLLRQLLIHSGLPTGLVEPPRGGGEPAERLDGLEEAVNTGDPGRLEELLERIGAAVLDADAPEDGRTALLVELYRRLSRLAQDSGMSLESGFRETDPGAVYDRSGGAYGEMFARLSGVARVLVLRHSAHKDRPARFLIEQARRFIEQRYGAWDLSLEEVADSVQLNPSYFSAVFKSVEGVNYIDYLTRLRLEKARELLEESRLKIGAVARRVGFQTPGYFGYLFRKHYGITPSEYRARHGS